MTIKIAREILKQIGDKVNHEEADGFTFYSSGDYLSLGNLINGQELHIHRVPDDDFAIMLHLDYSKKIPRKEEITKWLRRALVAAKESLADKKPERLEEEKARILGELRDVRKKIRDRA